MDTPLPERSAIVRRQAARLCRDLGWAPLHEVSLPNGRRADILALRRDGDFACIEIKSGPVDFLTDSKWPQYREYADTLYFAVDTDFPQALLPQDVGVIVASSDDAVLVREAPIQRMTPARRRSLTHRFAALAACRLEAMLDPVDRFALSCE